MPLHDLENQLITLQDRQAVVEKLQIEDREYLGDDTQQLVSRYNHLMDDMAAAQAKSPLNDPMVALPSDIWETILRDSLGPDFDFDLDLVLDNLGFNAVTNDGPETWIVDRLLCLTTVSQHWKESILSTPSFWTNLTIFPQIEDLEAKVHMCIQLSADLPLRLYWKFPVSAEIWTVVGPSIARQASRIRLIHLFGNDQYPYELNRIPVDILLDSLADLSSLEVLSSLITGLHLDIDATPILKQTNRIRLLRRMKINQEIATFSALKSMRSLEARSDMFQILPLLKEMESLKEVTFSRHYSLNSDLPEIEYFQRKTETLAAIKGVYLPWRSLKVIQGLVEPIEPVLRCVSSTLVELRILIDWKTLPEVLLICSQMNNLEYLTLGFTCAYRYYFQSLPEYSPPPKLHTLSIIVGETHAGGQANAKDDIRNKGADDCLFEILIKWAPFVRHLSITTCSTRISPYYYMETLQELEYLTIDFSCAITANIEQQFKLNSVKRLQMNGWDRWFSVLSCPNATELVAEFYDATNDTEPQSRIDTEKWGNLRSVDSSCFQNIWRGESLSHLETIALRESGSFLHYLALHPSELPSLIHLRIKAIPDWSLLFIMLERRNFQGIDNVAPISKLALPSFPPPGILQPLVSRLRGRLSARPPNFDLSLDSIGPLFVDKTISGCAYCLKSFMFCTRSPTPDDLPFNGNVKLPQLPPYPSTSDKVLEGALERNLSWTTEMYQCQRELMGPCNRHDLTHLTEIDGYTKVDQYTLSSAYLSV